MKKVLHFLLITISMVSLAREVSIGQCIILNGPSSAEKSTLACCLQKDIPGCWEIAHHSLYADQVYENIAQKLESGTNIIVDTSLYKKQDFIIAQQALRHYNPFFVFVHVPFEKLVEWVNKRNAGNDVQEHRFLNQVMHQYACCYSAQETTGIDTVGMLSAETVYNIVHTYSPCSSDCMSPFLPTGDQLIKEIMSIIGISNDYNMLIRPRLLHDIIIDTCNYSSEQASFFVRNAFFYYSEYSQADKLNRNMFSYNRPEMLYD